MSVGLKVLGSVTKACGQCDVVVSGVNGTRQRSRTVKRTSRAGFAGSSL